jgi:tetratricopeptide (TPR) repeat protein
MRLFNKLRSFICLMALSISFTLAAQVSNQATAVRMSEADIQLQDKYLSGMVQYQLGKLDGAAKLFQEVLQKNPKCDACAFQLARVYTEMKDNQKALEYAKQAVTIDAKNKWYKMALAESYEKSNKDKEAAEVYKAIIEQNLFDNDYSREIYFRLTFCYVRMSDPNKALKILDDMEKKTGYAEDITTKKVTIYEALGDNKKAAIELKKLADKFPHDIGYQQLAAEYFQKLGDKNIANEFYQRILKIDPSNSKALLATATATKPNASGNGSNSDIEYLNSLKDLFKKSDIKIDDKIKTFLPYAQKIAEGKNKALAAVGLELAQIIETAHPTEAKSYSLTGDMLYYNGKVAEAIEKYKKCTQINKSVYAVWEQLLYAQEELGLYADMLKTSEQALDLFPSQASAFFFNGLANEKKGNLSDAVASLEQAVMMSSKKPALKHDVFVELGVTHAKAKTYDKAEKAFEDALKLNNKSSIAMIKYANAFAHSGTADKAKLMADEAIKISMETDPSVLEYYGDYLFKTGDKDNAVKYWLKAKERGSKAAGLDKKIAERNMVE